MGLRNVINAGAALGSAVCLSACVAPGGVDSLYLPTGPQVEEAQEIYNCFRELARNQRGPQPALVVGISGGGLSINGDAGIGNVSPLPTKLTSHLLHDFALLGPALKGTPIDEVRIVPGARGQGANNEFHAVLRVDVVGFQAQYACDSDNTDWAIIGRFLGIDGSKSRTLCLSSLRLKGYLLDRNYETVSQAAATVEIDLATKENQGGYGVNVYGGSIGQKAVERRFAKVAAAIDAAVSLAVVQTLGLGLRVQRYHECSPALPALWGRLDAIPQAGDHDAVAPPRPASSVRESGDVEGVVHGGVGGIVNVRVGPSLASRVAHKAHEHASAVFSCHKQMNGWVPIQLKHQAAGGWIRASFSPCAAPR